MWHSLNRWLLIAMLCCMFVSPMLAFRKQKVSVKGRVLCGTRPSSDVRVKLTEEDSGPDPDDELDAGYTNANGEFELSGDTREFGSIEPFLKIYHDCNDHGKPCQRKWKIAIPDKYINSKEVMNFHTMNLEVALDDEERDCIN